MERESVRTRSGSQRNPSAIQRRVTQTGEESQPQGWDWEAEWTLLALNERSYRVPDDTAVVGFDGLPSSRYTVPPLTTIRQPVYEKGQQAANMLIDDIEDADAAPGTHTELAPELVVRTSCGADG